MTPRRSRGLRLGNNDLEGRFLSVFRLNADCAAAAGQANVGDESRADEFGTTCSDGRVQGSRTSTELGCSPTLSSRTSARSACPPDVGSVTANGKNSPLLPSRCSARPSGLRKAHQDRPAPQRTRWRATRSSWAESLQAVVTACCANLAHALSESSRRVPANVCFCRDPVHLGVRSMGERIPPPTRQQAAADTTSPTARTRRPRETIRAPGPGKGIMTTPRGPATRRRRRWISMT